MKQYKNKATTLFFIFLITYSYSVKAKFLTSNKPLESESIENLNDDNKFDIALLKYSTPLLKIHLKLIIHKLSILLESSFTLNSFIFSIEDSFQM